MGESIAIHDAYGAALKELGEQNKKIMDPEADVVSSTKSGIFGRAFPKRYSNVGISEPDMMSMSARFTREGLVLFVNTLAVFLTTGGANPIQSLIAYDKLSVKLCDIYCGLSDPYDGTSHQVIIDLAFVGTIPNITVITVADAVETKKAVFVIVDCRGPVCLRLSRTAAPVYCSEDMKFEIDKGITARGDRDVTIITTETVLYKALAAAGFLEAKGIQTRVVGMHTIEPVDEELIIGCARGTGAIVTVEEHSICDGLRSAVTEVLTEHIPVPMTHIRTTDFTESRDYEQLLVKYSHDPGSITERCVGVIKRK